MKLSEIWSLELGCWGHWEEYGVLNNHELVEKVGCLTMQAVCTRQREKRQGCLLATNKCHGTSNL